MPTHDAQPGADEAPDGALPPRLSVRPFLGAWVVFWSLMLMVSLQDAARAGHRVPWEPLAWEGSSCLVASVLASWLWGQVRRADALLAQPWRWFAASLRWLPLAAPAFVVLVYAIRHGLYALAGSHYRHSDWTTVFAYEGTKFALFYLLFVALVFGLRSHAAMVAERLRAERLRALTQQARVLQLTQQLEPHFLFNALNTIAATVHVDAQLADTLLVRLATLLRAATDLARQPRVPLARELELLQAYAAIMEQRFAPRVSVHFDLAPDSLDCPVPTLLLQPLLENAFRHGAEQIAGPCRITVRGRRVGQRLHLEVENDGPALAAQPADGTGLGNLRQRLALLHGDAAWLRLQPRAGGGALASVELPCAS